MEIVLVTGLSGAGKSRTVDVLEDIGFYCVDNVPPKLISKFAEICAQSSDKLNRVAIVTDARGGTLFNEFLSSLKEMKECGQSVKILFLDANDSVLMKRYKETRRKHPLLSLANGSVEKAIDMERSIMQPVREQADYYIDTSMLSSSQLRQRVSNLFVANLSDTMAINIMSFGFKYGILSEADLVFDVRCLPNPFYIDELREHKGTEAVVQDYVLSFEQSRVLLDKLTDLVEFLVPLYIQEGKSQLVIGFGCTGGKHRSVTFAEKLTQRLITKGIVATVTHRDIQR